MVIGNYDRMAGNAAYIIGLISETELGQLRLRQATPDCPEFLSDLVQLLNCDDDETIMNAVGALGTLVGHFLKIQEWKLKFVSRLKWLNVESGFLVSRNS